MLRSLAICAFAGTLCAAEMPLPNLRIEPTGGGSILYVKNTSAKPLTAFLIELVDYPGSSYSLYQDDLATGAEPIAPGAERRIQITNMTVGAVPDYVKLRSALFADGSSAGIPEKVTNLVERRRAILATARELIKRLEQQPPAEIASLQPTGKPKRDSQEAINQAAIRSLISSVEKAPPADALARLRSIESALR